MTRQKKRPRLWQRKRSAEVLLSQLMWSANYSPLSYERVTCWGLCSVIVMCVDMGLAEAKHSYHAGSVYSVLLNWNRMGSSSLSSVSCRAVLGCESLHLYTECVIESHSGWFRVSQHFFYTVLTSADGVNTAAEPAWLQREEQLLRLLQWLRSWRWSIQK